MAIFVPGMKCPLCHRPITCDQERRLFPPFVKDADNPLFIFHDATVHEECFLRDPRAAVVERIVALRKRPIA